MEGFVNILMYGVVGIAGIVFLAFAIVAIISMIFWSYMVFKECYIGEEVKEEVPHQNIDWENELESLSNDLKKMSKENSCKK